MKKLLPQEIMFDDCPACGMPINKKFVQSILQEVWNKALAQEAEQYPEPTLVATDKYMTTNLDTSFRYICRECKFGFEGNCEGCYLLNEQVKNQ